MPSRVQHICRISQTESLDKGRAPNYMINCPGFRTIKGGPVVAEIEEELRSSLTTSVETAGKALGLSRVSAYQAARRGELPVIRIGRRWVVPTGPLLTMLGRSRPAVEAV